MSEGDVHGSFWLSLKSTTGQSWRHRQGLSEGGIPGPFVGKAAQGDREVSCGLQGASGGAEGTT